MQDKHNKDTHYVAHLLHHALGSFGVVASSCHQLKPDRIRLKLHQPVERAGAAKPAIQGFGEMLCWHAHCNRRLTRHSRMFPKHDVYVLEPAGTACYAMSTQQLLFTVGQCKGGDASASCGCARLLLEWS